MLSLHRMSHLVEDHDTPRLLAELDGHGLTWPLPLRIQLEDAPAAAWALALRRVCELTHGPTPLTRELTTRLLDLQQPHGAWTLHDQDDALTTALAAAALYRRLAEPAAAQRQEEYARLRLAHEAALAALSTLQNPQNGLFDPPAPESTPGDAEATSGGGGALPGVAVGCFILFLLAEDPDASMHLRMIPLRDAVEAHADRFDPTLREVFAMAELLLTHRHLPAEPLAA